MVSALLVFSIDSTVIWKDNPFSASSAFLVILVPFECLLCNWAINLSRYRTLAPSISAAFCNNPVTAPYHVCFYSASWLVISLWSRQFSHIWWRLAEQSRTLWNDLKLRLNCCKFKTSCTNHRSAFLFQIRNFSLAFGAAESVGITCSLVSVNTTLNPSMGSLCICHKNHYSRQPWMQAAHCYRSILRLLSSVGW